MGKMNGKNTSGSKAADKVLHYCTLLHVGNKLRAGLTVLLDQWQTEECFTKPVTISATFCGASGIETSL